MNSLFCDICSDSYVILNRPVLFTDIYICTSCRENESERNLLPDSFLFNEVTDAWS